MHVELASQQYSPLVTLLRADFLLTARDLPGWPGKFSPISFGALIRATFKLIEKTTHKNELLVSELNILKEIAKQHNLLNLFNELLLTTKRKVVIGDEIHGFMITNSITFEGTELGIRNIYDASLAVNFLYNFYKKISFKEIVSLIKRTIRIIKRNKTYNVERLPDIN